MVRANREIQIPGFELLEQLRDNADLEFRGQRGVPARIASKDPRQPVIDQIFRHTDLHSS